MRTPEFKERDIRPIPAGTGYLNDVMPQLPRNCLFDKGKVGCGGTTLAIESEENYIICVPFVSLIENKTKQHDNVLGVYRGVTETHLRNYLAGDGVKKIMVTYDSLPRVMAEIDPEDYHLLVDEYHLLLTQYAFRSEAANTVLKNYKAFKSFCFMTATPIEEDFMLEQLKGIDIVEAVWEDVREVKVQSVRCVKTPVDGTVMGIIEGYLKGHTQGNAYIFVNSVEFIKDLVKNCGLDESNCRVIYSKQNKTKVGIPRGGSLDAPKKINLLTSTVFEGADFYDEDGRIYIVSDSRKHHTLTDISTSFQQIAGRIRNTKYWDTITHVFTTTRYSDLSFAEFKAAAVKQIAKAQELVAAYNKLPKFAIEPLTISTESYVTKAGDKFVFDQNLVMIDLYNFKVCHCLYKLRVNMNNELRKNGFTVQEYDSAIHKDVVRMDSDAKTFKDVVIEIKGLSETSEAYLAALHKYPFLKDVIEQIGFEGIERKGYVMTNIKREMIKRMECSTESKIAKCLKLTNKFATGAFISAKEAKSIIAKCYEDYGVKKTPKIKDFYEVKESSRRVGDKVVAGYTVIMPKLILNEESDESNL